MQLENAALRWETDFRGKLVVVASHLIAAELEKIADDLRSYAVAEGDTFRVSGFVLGRVLDQSVHSQYWVDFPWASPVQVNKANIIKVLLDDECEPDVVDGLPRLM